MGRKLVGVGEIGNSDGSETSLGAGFIEEKGAVRTKPTMGKEDSFTGSSQFTSLFFHILFIFAELYKYKMDAENGLGCRDVA
jgi:hypothetical protein